MDSDLVFLLAILALYAFQALMGKKRKPTVGAPAPPSPRPSLPPLPGEEEPDMELGDALAEIRRALGWDPPAPAPPPSESPRQRVFHSLEDQDETYDDAFEKRPARRAMPEIRPGRFPQTGPAARTYDERFTRSVEKDDRYAFQDALAGHSHDQGPVATPRSGEPHPVTRRLRTREALREAFILKEIVGPPRSLRRTIR